MVAEIDQAHKDGDTLGGVVEVVAYGLPPGLGSHVHWDRRLDARLAGALMGIQAIKGVEVGDGFDLARTPGSPAHDEMEAVAHDPLSVRRRSGRSGGTEGGMSTGEVLRVRAAMKPIATVPRALGTVDTATGEAAVAHHQRSDVCAVPAAGIVAEAMVALVLADAVLEKFGGDSVAETARNHRAPTCDNLRGRGSADAVSPVVVLVGAPGGRQDHRRRGCWPRSWAWRSGTPTPTSRPPPARSISDIFVEHGEPHFRALESAAVARARWPATTACWPSAAARCWTPPPASCSRSTAVVLPGRRRSPRPATRVGLNRDRPLLLGNVRGTLMKLLDERRPALPGGRRR